MDKIGHQGRYLLKRELGRGAMGVVREGWDTELERKVAVKTIRTSRFLDPEIADDYAARFIQEARNAGQLIHPNIVTVFDFGNEAGVAYLVMELIHGTELKAHLDARHVFDFADAVGIACQLLEALDYMHSKNMFHRDIKPANIMLEAATNRVRLTDFGVAHFSGATWSEGTGAGTVVGTPSYMSPEQIKGLPASAATDLFATGVLLYQCLTLQKPFVGNSEWEILQAIVNGEVPPMARYRDQVPAALERAVLHALARDPRDRPASARAFIRELRDAIAEETFDADATRMVDLRGPDGAGADPGSGPGTRALVLSPAHGRSLQILAPQAPEIEIEFWRSINDSDPEEFRLYLERFPEGTYADLARLRIAKLAAPADRRPAGDQASLVRRDARHDRGRDHTMPPRRLSASEARRAQEAEAQRRTAAEREVMRKAEEGWKATEAWCRAEVEQLARLVAKSQPVQFANQNEQAGPAEQAGQDELVQIEREELVPPVTEAKQTRREKASEVNAPARQAAHPVASPVTQERLLAMALIARASAEAPRLGVSSYKTLPFLLGFGLALFVALVAAGILLQPETAPRLIPVTQPPVVTAAPATPSGPPDDVVEPTRPGPEAPAPTAALNVPDNGKNVGPVPPPARPGPVDAETIRHARARDTKAAGGQNVPVHQEAGENTAPPRLPPGPDAKWSQIDQRAKEPARPTGPQVPTATPGGTLLPGADTGGDSRPAPEVPDRTRDAVDFGNIYGRRSRVVTPGYAEQFRWPGTKPNAVEAPAPDPTATPRAAARPTEAETAREREERKTDLVATEKRQKMEGYIETARRAEAKGDNRRAFIMYGMAFVSGNDSDAPRSIRETGGRAARAMGDMFGRAGNRAEQLKWYEKAKAMGAEVPLPGKPQH